jgi:hypothetical protein
LKHNHLLKQGTCQLVRGAIKTFRPAGPLFRTSAEPVIPPTVQALDPVKISAPKPTAAPKALKTRARAWYAG